MSVRTKEQAREETRQRLMALLDGLSMEELAFLEKLVLVMQQENGTSGETAVKEESPYTYPTVDVPASSLSQLMGIMPPVAGDALADTEALYES